MIHFYKKKSKTQIHQISVANLGGQLRTCLRNWQWQRWKENAWNPRRRCSRVQPEMQTLGGFWFSRAFGWNREAKEVTQNPWVLESTSCWRCQGRDSCSWKVKKLSSLEQRLKIRVKLQVDHWADGYGCWLLMMCEACANHSKTPTVIIPWSTSSWPSDTCV